MFKYDHGYEKKINLYVDAIYKGNCFVSLCCIKPWMTEMM